MSDKYFPLYPFVLIAALIITAIIEHYLIPYLKAYAKQPIYEGGPRWHISKSGTPTMGGIAFIITSLFCLGFCSFVFYKSEESDALASIILITMYSTLNGLIGVFDDLIKLKRQKNGGLTPKQKLVLQSVLAVLFLIFRAKLFDYSTVLKFTFGSIDLGVFYYPLAILLLLGMINFANLTDGIDGLASIVAFSVGVVLFYLSASFYPDVASISVGIIGISVGFLLFNLHPAKIFMGDTGSLFLGSLIISSAFSLENPFIILFIGGVYVIEGGSVIIQVLGYKLTKKRVFKMAPLHHHLEQCKLSENTICIIAVFVTFILSIIARLIFVY